MFSSRLSMAIDYALELHKDQKRKGGIFRVPYSCHILQVTGIVLEYNGSEDDAIAAVFHDALEDQGSRELENRIEDVFGTYVLNVIKECTMQKPPKDYTMEQKVQFLREQREIYLKHLETASEGALRVSCADKLHNLRSLLKDLRLKGKEEFNTFKGGREQIIWYFNCLASAFANSVHLFARDTATEMFSILRNIESSFPC